MMTVMKQFLNPYDGGLIEKRGIILYSIIIFAIATILWIGISAAMESVEGGSYVVNWIDAIVFGALMTLFQLVRYLYSKLKT